MDKEKLHFIQHEFCQLAAAVDANATSKWGKMNAQQMAEHVAAFFKISTNRLKIPAVVNTQEQAERLKLFLYSDKEFRENTKAPMLPDEPFPVRHASMKESVEELKKEVDFFVELFESNPGLITQHPVFGDLNFDEWVMLHYKHVLHHAKQFGLR